MTRLTSNSYAVLGLLSVRPWSAYELSKQIERSMAFYWPRAERAIYYEPKKLVEHGCATATTEATGRRRRTVYSITRKGHRALSQWLGEPSAPPQLESEAMVRVLFGDAGSKEDLLRAIRSVREHALVLRAQAEEVIRGYVDRAGPFPERLHVITLTALFNVEYPAMLLRWAAWAEREVERWSDTSGPDVFPAAAEVLRALLDDLVASAGEDGPGHQVGAEGGEDGEVQQPGGSHHR